MVSTKLFFFFFFFENYYAHSVYLDNDEGPYLTTGCPTLGVVSAS